MPSGASLAITTALGMLTRVLVLLGLKGTVAIYGVVITVTFVMLLYVYSNEVAFTRQLLWPYFMEWLTQLVGTAGAYHLTEEGLKLTAQSGDTR